MNVNPKMNIQLIKNFEPFTMSWIDKQVSLYTSHRDNFGRPASYREILKSIFGSNMNEIIALRQLDIINDPEYKVKAKVPKSKLQCYTPAGLLKCKAIG